MRSNILAGIASVCVCEKCDAILHTAQFQSTGSIFVNLVRILRTTHLLNRSTYYRNGKPPSIALQECTSANDRVCLCIWRNWFYGTCECAQCPISVFIHFCSWHISNFLVICFKIGIVNISLPQIVRPFCGYYIAVESCYFVKSIKQKYFNLQWLQSILFFQQSLSLAA